MHHLANSINKLCHGKKQDSTGWKDVPMYHCSREEAAFVIVGRDGGLFICQRVDEISLPAIFRCKKCNKAMCDCLCVSGMVGG